MTFLNKNIVSFIFLSFQLLSFLFSYFLSFSDRISFFLVSFPLSLVLKRHPEGSNSFLLLIHHFFQSFWWCIKSCRRKRECIKSESSPCPSNPLVRFFDLVSFPSTFCCLSKIISHFFLFLPYGWLSFSTDHYIFSSCSAIFFHDFTFSATNTWGKMCSQFSLKLPGRKVFIFLWNI